MTKTVWVDFKEVRAQVSIEQVLLGFYGLTNLKREGQKLVGPCPVHGGDSPRAFAANLTKNTWYCHSRCKGGGNQLDLVAKKDNLTIREAALRLQERFMTTNDQERLAEGSANTPSPPATSSELQKTHNEPINVSLDLRPDHPHLTEHRGLTPEVIEAFGLGYCTKGILRGCIAIPIHNPDGQLVAYAGRRLKEDSIQKRGKYVFPKGFEKRLELFNYHRARANLDSLGLVVVEGFFAAIMLTQVGFENVVAIMGTSASDQQLALLARARSVTILFDGDEAGRSGGRVVAAALTERTNVRLAEIPLGLDPEVLGQRTLRWLIRGLHELDLAYVHLGRKGQERKGETSDDGRWAGLSVADVHSHQGS